MDDGTMDNGTMDDGTMGNDTMHDGTMHPGTMHSGTMHDEAMHDGLMHDDTMHDDTMHDGQDDGRWYDGRRYDVSGFNRRQILNRLSRLQTTYAKYKIYAILFKQAIIAFFLKYACYRLSNSEQNWEHFYTTCLKSI